MPYNPLEWNEIINQTEWERLGALARHKVNIIMAGSIYFGNDTELNEIREIVKAAGFNVSSGRNSELAKGVYRLLRGLTLPAPDKGDSPAPENLSTLEGDTAAEHEPTPAPCG